MSDQKPNLSLANAPDTPEKESKDPAQVDYEAGVNYLNDGNLSHAANAFHNALIGFEQNSDQPGVANANDKLGDLCRQRNEFEKALAYYEKSYKICEEKKDSFSLISLRKKNALCYIGLKQYDQAIEINLDLLEHYQKGNNPGSTVEVLQKLADIYYDKNELKACIDAYKTAASIHANFGHLNQAGKLTEKAAEIEKKLKS